MLEPKFSSRVYFFHLRNILLRKSLRGKILEISGFAKFLGILLPHRKVNAATLKERMFLHFIVSLQPGAEVTRQGLLSAWEELGFGGCAPFWWYRMEVGVMETHQPGKHVQVVFIPASCPTIVLANVYSLSQTDVSI